MGIIQQITGQGNQQQPPPQPLLQPEWLTAEVFRPDVRHDVRMMSQQTTLREISNRNALELLKEERTKAAPSLMDAINEGVQCVHARDNQ